MDPFADLFLRLTASGVVREIEAHRAEEVVFVRTSLLDPTHLRWRTVPFNEALKLRRSIDLAHRSHFSGKGGGAVCKIDVKNFYPSVRIDPMQALLLACGVTNSDFAPLLNSLKQLSDFPNMPNGLPIGPEVSACLATFVLGPVDQALRRGGFRFARWSDDIWIYGAERSDLRAAIAIVSSQLQSLGMELNVDKTRFEDIEESDSDFFGDSSPNFVVLSRESEGGTTTAVWRKRPRLSCQTRFQPFSDECEADEIHERSALFDGIRG